MKTIGRDRPAVVQKSFGDYYWVASGLGREFAQASPRGNGVDVVYGSVFRWRVTARCERLLLRFAYGRSGSSAVVGATRPALIRRPPREPTARPAPISAAGTDRSRPPKLDSEHEAPGCCTPYLVCLRSSSSLGRRAEHHERILRTPYFVRRAEYLVTGEILTPDPQ